MSYKTSDFTSGQRAVLNSLGAAGAIERDKAITIISPGAATKLIDGFFCQKRTDRPKGGSQRTVYWLTERGQRAWRAITEAATDD